MKYKIVQLIDIHTPYAFMNYDYAKKNGFSFSDYKVVYEGEIEGEDQEQALEDLWVKFNINHPADFKGHSLSVSDIVELNGLAHYCDSIGWVAL